MAYRYLDPFLDPIFVTSADGVIQYLNPIAIYWLALPDDYVIIGKNLSQFVTIKNCKSLDEMSALGVNQHTAYNSADLNLPIRHYQALVSVCVQRLATIDHQTTYATIIRDPSFVKSLLEESSDTASVAPQGGATPEDQTTAPKGFAVEEDVTGHVLDEKSAIFELPTERKAKLECTVNLVFIELHKALVGKVTLISDEWIQIHIHNLPGLKSGTKVNLEVAGNTKMRGFSSIGEFESSEPYDEDLLIKVKLGHLSNLARKSLDEYLEVHAKKLATN